MFYFEDKHVLFLKMRCGESGNKHTERQSNKKTTTNTADLNKNIIAHEADNNKKLCEVLFANVPSPWR